MPNAAMRIRQDPEIVQINRARRALGMAPLPTDEELNEMIRKYHTREPATKAGRKDS